MIMRTKYSKRTVPTQTVGNIGLYYVCYKLSLFGWNVLPTSRNTKGIDIVIFSQNGIRRLTLQIKTLSKRNAVPLGSNIQGLIADYVIVCVRYTSESPRCYLLTSAEVREMAHKKEKNGEISYWLPPPNYEGDLFIENWERIGQGVP